MLACLLRHSCLLDFIGCASSRIALNPHDAISNVRLGIAGLLRCFRLQNDQDLVLEIFSRESSASYQKSMEYRLR